MGNESDDWYARLSRAEREVLESYSKHHSYIAVARVLGKSESVVDQQLLSARRKMDVISTAEAMYKLADRNARLTAGGVIGDAGPAHHLADPPDPDPGQSLPPADDRPTPDYATEFESTDWNLEPPGGAVLLSSRFYVKRHGDAVVHNAVIRRDGLVRIRGPRQVGKSSLLARGLAHARQTGARVVVTDLQRIGVNDLSNLDDFYFALSRRIAAQLGTGSPRDYWAAPGSAVEKFDEFFESEVLRTSKAPLFWGIDEADAVFDQDYSEEVFSHMRGRFNARALEGNSLWQNVTTILTYSTEAHLLIRDLARSPFNVGTAVELDDFTPNQVSELNTLYGCPLRSEGEIARLYSLVGGHPYLVRHCLYEAKSREIGIKGLEEAATGDFGFFADHLDRMRIGILGDEALVSAVRGLLRGESGLSADCIRRLRSAGIVGGPSGNESKMRCRLYELFLSKLLS